MSWMLMKGKRKRRTGEKEVTCNDMQNQTNYPSLMMMLLLTDICILTLS